MAKSIMQDNTAESFLSKRTDNLDKHHIFNGALRQKSEKYGLWVMLNHDEHMFAHHTVKGQKVLILLKQLGQKAFEEKYGHEEYMKEFHKNYL